jgi:archaellum component FlaC
MIVEILLGVFVILFIGEIYITWNLMQKTELLETWIEDFTVRVDRVQNDLKDIDDRGHFESDDEIGAIFDGIKEIIEELQQFTEGVEDSNA